MDDLTFRRTVYADPFTKQVDVINAAKSDPKKQAFWDEIKAMETSIEQAMNVSVPENLADKLLLRQSITEHTEQQQKRPWYIAMAASVALAALVTVGMLTQSPSGIAIDALAHVEHVEMESQKFGLVNLEDVNTKLANYNGSINQKIGEIVSANYCYLSSIKSLHLIIKGQEGLMSLFVLPNDVVEDVDSSFSNEVHSGTSFLLESARIIVVGEDSREVSDFSKKAKQLMQFSA